MSTYLNFDFASPYRILKYKVQVYQLENFLQTVLLVKYFAYCVCLA